MATYRNIRKVLNLPTLSASPGSGVNGEMYFNTADLALYIYDGEWKKVTQSAATPTYDWTTTAQQAKLEASDPNDYDYFGDSVDIDGDTAVVGAGKYYTGLAESGDAYIFTRSGTSWSQQAKLTPSDGQDGDWFGWGSAIAGDTAVVGAPREDTPGSSAGSAYVFTRSGTSWSQQAKIQSSDIASGDNFGKSVSISNNTIIAGAESAATGGSNNGAAYVFTRSGTSWSQEAKLTASDAAVDDEFGFAVAIDGDTAVVGAKSEDTGGTSAGSAYIFTRSGTTWSQQAKLNASDPNAYAGFGLSVGISGDSVIIGAWGNDTTAAGAGAAYVFTRSGTSWSEEAKLTASDGASDDNFGFSVDIAGDTVIVSANYQDTGGSNAGAAYIFTRSGTSWTQAKKIQSSDIAANDKFGQSVAINGNTAIVGSMHNGTTDRGAAYTFVAG